jgi:hypothetical protein
MLVEYSVNHANNVNRMLNLNTKSIIQSRDIIWLNGAHQNWIERKVLQKKEIVLVVADDEDDFIANTKIQEFNDCQDN